MALRHSVTQGCLVVELPPEVDISNAELVRMELADLCRARLGPAATETVGTVVVDWTRAPLLTMAGAAVLEDLRSRTARHSIPLKLVVGGSCTRRVLRVLRLDEVMPVYDSLTEVLADSDGSDSRRTAD